VHEPDTLVRGCKASYERTPKKKLHKNVKLS
jgi:hypothetical protein